MKRYLYAFAVVLFSWSMACAQSNGNTQRIILKINTGSSQSFDGNFLLSNSINAIAQKYNAYTIKKHFIGGKHKFSVYLLDFPEGSDLSQIVREYSNVEGIEYAEPDYIGTVAGIQATPNDQYYGRQWGLKNDGIFALSPSISGADIEMENAWNISQGSSTVVVGVIDSGTKLDHPEFAGRIWTNADEIPNNMIDDDNNGYVDDVNGWDFAYADNNPTDDRGHGTNVMGIIGSNGNNSIGYSGVDRNCKLMPLKAIDASDFGYYSWFASAIYYAVDNGAKVINMSVGGSGSSTTLQDAVTYAVNHNVVVVACMMNTNSNTTYYPAGCTGVIAVGSTNPNDTRSAPFFWSSTSGSNFGNHISVVAPGNYTYGLDYLSNTNYNSYWGGTSQASPHVAGLAALLLAQDASRTPALIKSIIEITAEDQVGSPAEDVDGWDQYFGYGRINAYNALSYMTLSMPEEDAEGDIRERSILLYPNPSTGTFIVECPVGATQIRVFNSCGELVLIRTIDNPGPQNVELSNSGMYVIQLVKGNQIASEKIVVGN